MIRRQKSKSFKSTERLRQFDGEHIDYDESSSDSESDPQNENDPVLSTYIRPYSREVNNSAMHSFAMMSTVIGKHMSDDERNNRGRNSMYQNNNIESRVVHPVMCKRDIFIGDRHHDKNELKTNKTSGFLKSVSISGSMLFRQKKMPKRYLADMSNTKRYVSQNPYINSSSNPYGNSKASTPMSHKERDVYIGDTNKSADDSSITTNTLSSDIFEEYDSAYDINVSSQMSI